MAAWRKTSVLLGKWRARRDSNSRPSGSKPDALIQLSYGRVEVLYDREKD
jgi:hypothetical protein